MFHGWHQHSMRSRLYNELHSRPFHMLENPAQLSHLAFQHHGKLEAQEQALLTELCNYFGVAAPKDFMPCFYHNFGYFSLRWERHMEFSTYTFIRQEPPPHQPFQGNAIDIVPEDWLVGLQGQLIAAVHVEVQNGCERNSSDSLAPIFDDML